MTLEPTSKFNYKGKFGTEAARKNENQRKSFLAEKKFNFLGAVSTAITVLSLNFAEQILPKMIKIITASLLSASFQARLVL